MNTSKAKSIFKIKDKVEFEKEILHFAFMQHIQENLHGTKRNSLATKIGVSGSFISQLFSGDKMLSLELLVKFQRALNFKFDIQVLKDAEQDQGSKVIPLNATMYFDTTVKNPAENFSLNESVNGN